MGRINRTANPRLVPWAVLTLGIAHVGLFWEIQPVATWFYPLAWWSYVIIADGWTTRKGAFSTLFYPFPAFAGLCLASLVFWMFFELLNLRISNWYYVGVPETRLFRWAGISLSFASILPLLIVTERLIDTLSRPGPCRIRPLAVGPRLLAGMQWTGALFLALPLLFPLQAFALVWGVVVLILEPANYRAARPSLLADLAAGSARKIITLLTAGLVCGLIWEAWNFWAVGKWIYTVPFLSDTRWFEMPPMGFLGFPPLALAAFAFHSAVCGWWKTGSKALRTVMVTAAVLFAGSVLWAMDRYTVDAPVPTVGGLLLLTETEREQLTSGGLKSARALAEISDAQLAELAAATGLPEQTVRDARDFMRLARHRGMGHANAHRLWRAGIQSVTELAALTPRELEKLIGEQAPERRKLSVWIQAAGK